MIVYKIDVLKELNKIGITSTNAKTTGILPQSFFTKIKRGDTSISLDTLNRLCTLLEMQPRDIIKFIETEQDRAEIIARKPQPPATHKENRTRNDQTAEQ